ncbi:MAG: HPr family phosphocarrier protein, partial [Planctomycetes bacterium]|nr:HPr family phosphocarrier protein [Planctomycetota bacterium]
DRQADGKSILSLMTLSAAEGDSLILRIQGPDSQELLAALTELVSSGFQEMS